MPSLKKWGYCFINLLNKKIKFFILKKGFGDDEPVEKTDTFLDDDLMSLFGKK